MGSLPKDCSGLPSWLLASNRVQLSAAGISPQQQQSLPAGAGQPQQLEQDNSVHLRREDEASLEELTALCIQPAENKAAATGTNEMAGITTNNTQGTALVHANHHSSDLDRADTHDSTSTANLLPMLQPGCTPQKTPPPLLPPAEPGGTVTPNQDIQAAAAGGAGDSDGGGAATGPKGAADAPTAGAAPPQAAGGTTTALAAAVEVEDDDEAAPLVGNRTNPILDIMCGRFPSNTLACAGGNSPTRVHSPQRTLPFLHSPIPAAGTGSNAFSPTPPDGGGILGVLVAASDPSASSFAEPFGLSVTSTPDVALLPSVFTAASSSPAGLLVPHVSPAPNFASASASPAEAAAVAAQGPRLLYAAVFLTPASREVLLSMVPPVHPLLRGDHMTLLYRPSLPQLLQFPLGAQVDLRVLGCAADARVQAVFVEAPAWLETASASAHVTISVALGCNAVDAGPLIRDALQQAALASAADVAYAPAGLGSYQHFEEALPLVGRLGVLVDAPAATAHSMGWAAAAAAAGDGAAGGGQRAGLLGLSEVVVFSVEELAAAGCFSAIEQTALDGFHRQHEHLLQAPAPCLPRLDLPALPQQPEAGFLAKCCASPDAASIRLLSSSTATAAPGGGGDSSRWLFAGSQPAGQTCSSPVSTSRVLLGMGGDFTPGQAAGDAHSSPLPGSVTPAAGSRGAFGAAAGAGSTSLAAAAPSGGGGGGLAALLAGRAGGGSAAGSPATTPETATPETQPTRGLAALLARGSPGTAAAGSNTRLAASSPPAGGGGGLAALLAAAAAAGGGAATAAAASAAATAGGSSPQLPPINTSRPGSAPPAPAVTAAAALASPAAAAVYIPAVYEPIEQLISSPRSPASVSSTDSLEAVQFLSAVHEGDYVALRPFVPTAGNERLVQGFVREFACDEPFQAEGVLVVLTDETIGYVASVLDSSCARDMGGSSSSSGGAATAGAKPSSSIKAAHSSSSKASLHTAALLSDAQPAAACSSPVAAGMGGSAAAAAADPSLGPLRQWMAHAGAAVALPDAAGSPPELHHRRNARDAERDLQLWRAFEALQVQHGEALCSTILESCNQDFAEAIELIKGQAGSLQQAAAAAAASGGGGGDDSGARTAAAATASPASPSRSPAASPLVGGRAPAAAAAWAAAAGGVTAAAAEVDEDFVRQLALSVGLLPNDAVQLARLVPHLPADAVVRELQQRKGDVSLAADALLSGQASSSAPAAAGRAGGGGGSRSSSAAVSPTAGGGSSRDAALRPEEHAMRAFRSGKDPERVLAAHRLRELSPGLTMELAELLLAEHGSNLHEAAQALEDMQARELQVRSAAVAAAAAGAGGPSSSGGHGGGHHLAGMEGLSAADRRAILEAMGEQQQQVEVAAREGSPPPHQPQVLTHGSPVRSPSPPQHQHHAQAVGQYQQQAQVAGGAARHYARPPPPPPPPRAAVVEEFINLEAQRADKEKLDGMWKEFHSLKNGANVHGTIAQDCKRDGDAEGYKEHMTKRNELRKAAMAAHDNAQRFAWRINNASRTNSWSVDLHGLGVPHAIAKFEKQFRCLQGMDHPGGIVMHVCVGKGLHSEGNVPKIKEQVGLYLDEQATAHQDATGQPWDISWEVDPRNTGMINVYFPPPSDGGPVDGGGA